MITPKNILPVTMVKRDLMGLLKKIEQGGDPLVITRDGRAAGVLLNPDEYESLMETLEILSDKSLIKSLKKADLDFRKKRIYTHDEVFGD